MTATDLPDASDEVTTNNRRSDAARYRKDDLGVLRKMMHDPKGRSWLHRTLEFCDIYGSPFTPGQADTTAFHLGQQNVGKRLLIDSMEASPDLYMLMIREAREEQERVTKTTRERNAKVDPDRDAPAGVDLQFPPLTPPTAE